MARQIESILLIKKDIEKLLKDYQDGRININQLEDKGEELLFQLLDETGYLEERTYQRGTLEFIYSDVLDTLECAGGECFFPEDVSIALEYLNTKESDDILAAIEKWEEYWRKRRGY